MNKVNYYSGESSKYPGKSVNVMEVEIDDVKLLAEIRIPDDEEDEDYGYDELCKEIIQQAVENGIDPTTFVFFRDEKVELVNGEYIVK